MSGAPPVVGLDARKARDFGIGTYTRELIAAIAARPESRELSFRLFVRSGDRELFEGLPGNFEKVAEDAAGYSIEELTRFAARLRGEHLDLYHAFHYVVPPRAGRRVVVTIHDLIHILFPDQVPGPLARLYARVMLGRAVRRADRVIAVSQATRADILRVLHADPARVVVVGEGVSARFRPDPPAPALGAVAARYGIPGPYVLVLGGARPHKNAATAVAAFARALEAGLAPGVTLVLAGPMPEGEAGLRREVGRRRLGHAVRIPGLIAEDDLPVLIAGARVLLFPSRYEGFGLPVAEAMACGVPVVASTAPAVAELAEGAADLFDPDDVEGFAGGIVRAAQDPELRERRRRDGLARAAALSWDRAAERTLAIYREVLSA